MLVAILLDIGNIIFFIGNLPQLITAYKHRKDLGSLSSIMLSFFAIAVSFFSIAGALLGAWIMCGLNAFNCIFFASQLYWKRKYKK